MTGVFGHCGSGVRWLAMFGLTVALGGCGGAVTRASAADDARSVGPFTQVVARGDYALEVRQGATRSVVLSGVAKDLADITTEVRGDTLFVVKKRGSDPGRVGVVIDVVALRSLTLAGSVDAEVSGLDSRDLKLLLAGSVDMDAAGTCGDAVIDVSGSVTIDGRALVCDRVVLDIAGAGDVDVHATEELVVSIAGSGRVDVYGDPARVIPRRISGAADINMK